MFILINSVAQSFGRANTMFFNNYLILQVFKIPFFSIYISAHVCTLVFDVDMLTCWYVLEMNTNDVPDF